MHQIKQSGNERAKWLSPTAVLAPEIFINIHKYILCQAMNDQGGERKEKKDRKRKDWERRRGVVGRSLLGEPGV